MARHFETITVSSATYGNSSTPSVTIPFKCKSVLVILQSTTLSVKYTLEDPGADAAASKKEITAVPGCGSAAVTFYDVPTKDNTNTKLWFKKVTNNVDVLIIAEPFTAADKD